MYASSHFRGLERPQGGNGFGVHCDRDPQTEEHPPTLALPAPPLRERRHRSIPRRLVAVRRGRGFTPPRHAAGRVRGYVATYRGGQRGNVDSTGLSRIAAAT